LRDAECVEFLRWALPRLELHWPGFRRVRRQVCKRIGARTQALGLTGVTGYRAYLETHADEWPVLDSFCRITISRFCRDRQLFAALGTRMLSQLVARAVGASASPLKLWSAGCASGEEAYTLVMLFEFQVRPSLPQLAVNILATDADPALLARAARGCYSLSSLKELPADWQARAFTHEDDLLCVRDEYRRSVAFLEQDIRTTMPDGPFHMILCRNLAFTYFAPPLQRKIAQRLVARLHPGGALVVGAHEHLPADTPDMDHWPGAPGVYQRSTSLTL
jgi:chemotaxis protein methyltransferase CheR